MKFTQEDKDIIAGLLASGEWRTVEKACDQILYKLERELVNAPISESSRELVIRKAKYDGARAVRDYVNGIKSQLRKEGLD